MWAFESKCAAWDSAVVERVKALVEYKTPGEEFGIYTQYRKPLVERKKTLHFYLFLAVRYE